MNVDQVGSPKGGLVDQNELTAERGFKGKVITERLFLPQKSDNLLSRIINFAFRGPSAVQISEYHFRGCTKRR